MIGRAWRVRGYASRQHPRVAPGRLLLETLHTTPGSRDAEVEAWKDRMRRGDAAYVEIVDMQDPWQTTKIYASEVRDAVD